MQIIGHPVRPLQKLILKKSPRIVDLQSQVLVKPAILPPGLDGVIVVKLHLRHFHTRKALGY